MPLTIGDLIFQEINFDIIYRLACAAPRTSYGVSHYDSDSIRLKSQSKQDLGKNNLEQKASDLTSHVLADRKALNDGNIDKILELFAEVGSIMEPSGGLSAPTDFFTNVIKNGRILSN